MALQSITIILLSVYICKKKPGEESGRSPNPQAGPRTTHIIWAIFEVQHRFEIPSSNVAGLAPRLG